MTREEAKRDRAPGQTTRVPDDLPPEPLASYNPTLSRFGAFPDPSDLIATRYAPGEPGASSDPSESPGSPGVLQPGEASQAEALGFKMLRMVGRGGMGEVWEAIQRRLGRIVAVKRLRRRRDNSVEEGTLTVARMFQAEARISALLDHPNIVPVYDLGFDEAGSPLLAMKMVSGTGWNVLLAGDLAKLTSGQVLERHIPILVQLAQAIGFAHSKGVVHRDLKPSQVMIGEFGEVLLLDWGLACVMGEPEIPAEEGAAPVPYPTVESADNPAGTPAYMAPEQTESTPQNIGPWTDMYLLGGILYQLITGLRPHPGETSDHAFKNAALGYVIPFAEACQGRELPAALCELAMSALNPVCAERPTAKQFLDQLQDYLTGASRRRDSMALTTKLRAEAPAKTYAGFVEALGRLGQAQRLWPENPEGAALRERIIEAYARFALAKEDLTLARAQAEQLQSSGSREALLNEVSLEEKRVAARRQRLAQLTVLIAILAIIMLSGGVFFTLSLKRAGEATAAQLVKTQTSEAAEIVARKRAQDESERALLLLADSLVTQDRREEAIEELLKVPESSRFWEWEFVMTRAMTDLWTSPFEYLTWSPSKNVALGFEKTQGFCALRAESGEVIAKLGDAVPNPLLVTYTADEKHAAYYAGDQGVRIVQTSDWTAKFVVDTLAGETLSALEVSPDLTHVALGYESGIAETVDVATDVRRAFLPHTHRIAGIAWGERACVVASRDSVRRYDNATGAMTIIQESRAISFQAFREFRFLADHNRRFVAFGYHGELVQYVGVDEGESETLVATTGSLEFSRRKPWLIVGGWTEVPLLSVWDLEKKELVVFKQEGAAKLGKPFYGEYRARLALGTSLNERENLILVKDDVSWRLYFFPHGQRAFQGEVKVEGTKRVVLAPNGHAAWVVRDNGETGLVSLQGGYVGPHVPGGWASFTPDGKSTASIYDDSFALRSVDTGLVTFRGGLGYNLYTGSSLSTDGKTIYLPGKRGGKYIIEKSDLQKGDLLATYEWDNSPNSELISADSARALFFNNGGTELAYWSLEGPEARLLATQKAPEGDAFVRAVTDGSGKRSILLMDSGKLSLRDNDTGEEVKSILAHEQSFSSVRMARDLGWLMTGSPSGDVLFSDNRTLEKVRVEHFDFPISGTSLSSNGRLLLAWPTEGAPVLRDLVTGKDVSKLARTDFPMTQVQFIANDTRLLAISGEEARLWDPLTGFEVFNIDSGFGGVSPGGGTILLRDDYWNGTLMELVPSRSTGTGSASGEDYREFLRNFQVERYKKWSVREVRDRVSPGLKDVRALSGTITGPRRASAIARWGSIMEFRVDSELTPIAIDAVVDFVMAQRLIDLSLVHIVDIDYHLGHASVQKLHQTTPRVASAILAYGAIRAKNHDENLIPYTELYNTHSAESMMQVMAEIYLQRGERERAVQIMRRLYAMISLVGLPPGIPAKFLSDLGEPLPAPPPPDIVNGYLAAFPPFVTKGWERIPPTVTGEERKIAEDAVWAEYKARSLEYLSATPPLDWDAILQEQVSSELWKGPPADMTITEFIDRLLVKLEPAIYDGLTQAEAIEAERKRLDELFKFMEPVSN